MSTEPDRFALMLICEEGERAGIDPDQVALLRSWVFERCQPKVKDVVEMAMRLRDVYIGLFDNLFDLNGRFVDPMGDGYLAIFCRDSEHHAGSKLASKLLEMTPDWRRMVAERVAEQVRGLERPGVEEVVEMAMRLRGDNPGPIDALMREAYALDDEFLRGAIEPYTGLCAALSRMPPEWRHEVGRRVARWVRAVGSRGRRESGDRGPLKRKGPARGRALVAPMVMGPGGSGVSP